MILQQLSEEQFPKQFQHCSHKLVLFVDQAFKPFRPGINGVNSITPKAAAEINEFNKKKQMIADTFEYCHREFGPPIFAVRGRPIDMRVYEQIPNKAATTSIPVLIEQSDNNYCWFAYVDLSNQEVAFRFHFSEHCVMTRMVI